ncbi:MAG TPA: extracellular solute-binding protein [Chloroflexota bacterium]|nr:extracellular solute-binding protein [Chloroflexota bacterium]
MVNRRQFIGRSGLLVGALLLSEACTPAAPAATSVSTSGAVAAKPGGSVFPAYVPFPNKPKPDYPSSGDPYLDGYDNFPKNPVKAITGNVGQNSTVTAMTIGLFPPPTPYENNPAWQAINKELNVDFKMNIVAPGDYIPKLATVMAGGDMPDLLFFYYNLQTAITAVAGVPQFLEAQGADLTPYLSGDAAKDYPSLASIPTRAWKNSGSVYNSKIIMIPKPLYSEGFVFLKNVNQWDGDLGKDYVPKNADDFKRVMLALTRPAEGRYATAAAGASSNADAFGLGWYSQLFGAPNQWRLSADGKLTRSFETPEYKETVAFVRDLYASGVYHPNTLQMSSGPNGRSDYAAGKWTIWLDGFATAWSDPWRRARASSNPFEVHMIPLFAAHDGGKPVHHLNAAHLGATAIKKGSPERVKELLRVLNYLAAPFGSKEDLLLSYGVEGPDYALDDKGNPVLTERGNPDANYLPFKYVAQRPSVLYLPDIPDFTRVLSDAEKQLIPIGIADPTVGFVSPTGVRQGVVVNQTFQDGMRDIVVNRRPMSDFDQLVTDWRSGGGETMRKEFQDAIGAAK